MCLIDLGLDSSFDASMTFVQATLQSINADWTEPIVDVDFVRSRDLDTVIGAFTGDCDILHVMAHGDHSESPLFISSDGKTCLTMHDLAETAADRERGGHRGSRHRRRLQDRNR